MAITGLRRTGSLGLYLADAPGAVQRMIQAARADSPQLRAATAWAMGHTGREEFYEELQKLADWIRSHRQTVCSEGDQRQKSCSDCFYGRRT